MNESKSTATDRLRSEGRWNEASRFKDETIAQLRREGMSRQDAQAAGWAAMLERFPSQPAEYEAVPSGGDTGADDLPDATPANFLNDAFWVYNQLGKSSVAASDAPSSGAWSLLRWAKRNEARFFEQIMPKALQLSTKLEFENREVDKNLQHVASLREMLGME